MANTHKLQTVSEDASNAKRKKVIAAVAQEIVTSEDDDNIAEANDICNIMENHNDQHKKQTSSEAIYALGATIRNTLLEINEIREQNRERRHKEILGILTKMVHHDTATSKLHKGNIFEAPLLKNQIKVNHQAGEDQHIPEQFTIIDELPVEPTIDEEFSNSNSTLTNMKSSALSSLTSIINPINSVNTVVVEKKQSQSDLEKMRAQMLEMQRKKMEDRVRKKREFLQIQNL